MFRKINLNEEIIWPKYDDKILIEENIDYVVQINGKKRALIETDRNITEDNLLKLISNNSEKKKIYR